MACALAIYAGSSLVQLSVPMLAMVTAVVLILLWLLTARDYWWTPVLTGATITGVFWAGFKIYPVEAALLLAVLGLVPLLLLHGERTYQAQRSALPLLFYAAAIYITARMSVDIVPAQGARGNLGRIYFDAIWPFFFGWLLYRYGKTSVVWTTLIVAFVMLSARAISGVVGYVYDIPLYIPGINYILSFSDADSLVPMRSVAYSLLILSLIFFHAIRSLVGKFLILFPMASSSVLIIMGASRFMTLMFLILPIFFFAWTRRWWLSFFVFVLAAAAIVTLNVSPHLLDRMPDAVGRSFSGLIIKPEATEAQLGTEGSTEWHDALRTEGYHRWTQSPVTIAFGYGIRPSPDFFDTKQYSLDQKTVVGIAANVGSYECSLWTVLAVLGSVGAVLYTALFIQFWQRLAPFMLRRPRGTVWEGVFFWGTYGSFLWFVTAYFQGKFPSLEIFLIILTCAIVEDGRLPLEKPVEDEDLPELEREPAVRMAP
jgi:hypothetical protein